MKKNDWLTDWMNDWMEKSIVKMIEKSEDKIVSLLFVLLVWYKETDGLGKQ